MPKKELQRFRGDPSRIAPFVPKIGVFDSGIGGLTVVQHLHRALPACPLIYCADTAHTPYGSRPPEEVTEFSLAITHFLLQKGVDILVVACGTASGCALAAIKREVTIPVHDVIAPLATQAATHYNDKTIALLATPTTIASGVMADTIEKRCPAATVIPLPCPQFVPLLERKCIDPQSVDSIVAETLEPLRQQPLDAALLGCTHYPLLTDAVSRHLGGVAVVDLSLSCAEAVIADLQKKGVNHSQELVEIPEIYVSAEPELFRHMAARVLPESIGWPVASGEWGRLLIGCER